MRNSIFIFLCLFGLVVACKEDELPAPVITDFNPKEGKGGSILTITGENFSTVASENVISFGLISNSATTASATTLTVEIPQGAVSGKIVVTVGGRSATSTEDFYFLGSPTITGLSASSGKAGDPLTIMGGGFSADKSSNTVTIGGAAATVTESTHISVKVTVPDEASTGSVIVTSPGGQATSANVFTVNPTIKSFSPSSGPLGTFITIIGTGFGITTTVKFLTASGRVDGVVTSIAATKLVATPPLGAIPGTLIVGGVETTGSMFSLLGTSISALPDFPGGDQRYAPTGFAIGTDLYFGIGGIATTHKDFWKFSTTTNTWTSIADFGGGALVGAAGFSLHGKGYVVGGAKGPQSVTKEIWQYEPTTNTWTKKNDFPGSARAYATAFSVGDVSFVATGRNDDVPWVYFNDLWQYNDATDSWTRKSDLPLMGIQNAASVVINGKVFIASGDGPGGRKLAEYDPGLNQWDVRISNVPGDELWFKCIGFTLNGIGFIVKDVSAYEMSFPGKISPVYAVWSRVEFPAAVVTPGGPGSNSYNSSNSGHVLTAGNKAYIWYGTREFWMFTPPN